MPHAGNSGLQRHSIGEAYPYAVKLIENAAAGVGVFVCWHAITGREVSRHSFALGNDAAFDIANAAAGDDAKHAAQRDRETAAAIAAEVAADLAQELSPVAPLWQCTVLLPAVPQEYGAELYPRFNAWLLSSYGGFTLGGEGRGVWRDPNGGQVYRDNVTTLYVAVPNPREFADRLRHWVREFRQLCLYFAYPTGEVELLYPAEVAAEVPADRNQRATWWGSADDI